MSYRTIKLEKDAGIATLTLNRPDVLNAISEEMFRELDEAVTDIENDESVRVAIFTGAGERAFCAGADIHEMARKAEKDGTQPDDGKRSEVFWRIATCSKPTIGALNGLAYGGGSVFASSFDIRVGCERSSFRFLAASYGRVNATWSLPMQIGWPLAKELLMSARVVDAKEAFRIGLLNHLVAAADLMDKARELAKQIAANDPRMVQGIKKLMIGHTGSEWAEMYAEEKNARATWLSATPVLEGFKEFLDRKGRK